MAIFFYVKTFDKNTSIKNRTKHMLVLKVLKERDTEVKYKRMLYAGTRRNNGPVLTEFIYAGADKTFEQEIKSVRIFPTLLIWDTDSGERKYGEVTETN